MLLCDYTQLGSVVKARYCADDGRKEGLQQIKLFADLLESKQCYLIMLIAKDICKNSV